MTASAAPDARASRNVRSAPAASPLRRRSWLNKTCASALPGARRVAFRKRMDASCALPWLRAARASDSNFSTALEACDLLPVLGTAAKASRPGATPNGSDHNPSKNRTAAWRRTVKASLYMPSPYLRKERSMLTAPKAGLNSSSVTVFAPSCPRGRRAGCKRVLQNHSVD